MSFVFCEFLSAFVCWEIAGRVGGKHDGDGVNVIGVGATGVGPIAGSSFVIVIPHVCRVDRYLTAGDSVKETLYGSLIFDT